MSSRARILRGPERGDPVEPGGPQLVADAGAGDHAAVPDQHHPRQPEALFELVDLRRQCRWIGGVAFEHLDRHRTAIGSTEQAVNDLQFALLAVPRIAEAPQLAAPSLEPGRRDIVQHQRTVLEVVAGERGLDRGLALTQPVEGAVEFDLVDRTEPEPPAQARTGGVGGEIARGGEFGGGCDEPAGDQRDRQRRQTLVGGPAEPPVEADCPDRAQHRGGVAVRQGAADTDPLLGHGDAALQEGAKALDQRGGPSGKIGQGALSDPALLAKAFAQQHGRG